jgi:pilus assembly protein CpaE
MLDGRPQADQGLTRVVVITADGEFEQLAKSTFGSKPQIELRVVHGGLPSGQGQLNLQEASVAVIDVDATRPDQVQALQTLAARLGGWPPMIVVTQAFSHEVARQLLQIRVADFLIKPVSPSDLVRACARVAQGPSSEAVTEAEICTFLPAAGGVGVTTLAVQTAILLLKEQRGNGSVCLVDLDFQHGSCCDYLDIAPQLDLREIEPRPERLDRQLLEVMLSRHAGGLAVIAAPNRPAEMRSFDPDMVTRLLDLVSSHFNHVVIDMPRTWFPWTDSVLFGSNKLYIVTETTVPGVRHAKQLITAIGKRLAGGPKPQVIVNRFEQHLFGPGLRRADIEQALGEAFAGVVPNNYRLVREAIDRGVPLDEVKANNAVSSALRKIVAPLGGKPAASGRKAPAQDRAAAWAR